MRARDFAGLRVVVESPAGSVRQWHDRAAGESGETVMRNDYGFLEGHVGSDGEEVDCYLGPDESAPFVHVVHQLRAPEFAAHDEDKVMLGFASEAEARAAYLAHRSDGERAYGGMTSMPLERFKAKLQRRTGDGKIRHERGVGRGGMQAFTISHRGDRWYVESESGKPMGDYGTEEEAKERLRQIEAAKAAKGMSLFDAARGPDGRVRAGLWDFVCVDGWDMKDQQYTEFTPETLAQMVANFADRGDMVAYDWNHQSGYAQQNGRPAPALAFAGALAVIWDGVVIACSYARGTEVPPPDPAGRQNGLWAHRTEVTDGTSDYPLGQQLLPGFKYISPMFTSHGENRHGEDVGYCLLAIACTNTPWQPGTQIAFNKFTAGAAGSTPQEGSTRMAKLAKLAAFMTSKFGMKFEGGADEDDKKVKEMALSQMEEEGAKAVMEEGYDHGSAASHLEEMAKLYEDAHPEPDGDEPAHVTMRRMAAKFRKMADPPFGGKETPEEEAAEDRAKGEMEEMAAFARSLGVSSAGKNRAQLMDAIKAAAVPASRVAELAKVAAQDAIAADKAERVAAEKKQRATTLMSRLRDDVPAENRAALQRVAERDPAEAETLAAPWLKKDAPAHLFSRITQQGAPVGDPNAGPRDWAGPTGPSITKTRAGAIILSADAQLADKAKDIAVSKDPVMMSRLDARLPTENDRKNPALRLIKAQELAAEIYPDLAAAAEAADLGFALSR